MKSAHFLWYIYTNVQLFWVKCREILKQIIEIFHIV